MDRAVLFADVAGSTALYEVLGDERALALVQKCLSTMSACTAEARGRVVKTIGDAVMAVFDTADDAATAAAEMQVWVGKLGPDAGVQLGVRIGFRFGPVVERDRDFFGDTVNLAARLCDLASKGQIITDQDTAKALSAAHSANLRQLFSVPVKGKEQEVPLVELTWHVATEEMTAIFIPASRAASHQTLLELDLDGERLEMGPQRRKVTIGRDASSDFPVQSPMVSRAHATIERRREHFVLSDHSSNGTFVTLEGRPEMRIHHEELTLVGQGWIAFGQPRAEAPRAAAFKHVEVRLPQA